MPRLVPWLASIFVFAASVPASAETLETADLGSVEAIARDAKADTVLYDFDRTLLWHEGPPGAHEVAMRAWARARQNHRAMILTSNAALPDWLRSGAAPVKIAMPREARVDLGGGAFVEDFVIFAPEGRKGATLLAYERARGSLGRIVFVDDQRDNVNDVVRAVGDRVVGVHFTAPRDRSAQSEAATRAKYPWIGGRRHDRMLSLFDRLEKKDLMTGELEAIAFHSLDSPESLEATIAAFEAKLKAGRQEPKAGQRSLLHPLPAKAAETAASTSIPSALAASKAPRSWRQRIFRAKARPSGRR